MAAVVAPTTTDSTPGPSTPASDPVAPVPVASDQVPATDATPGNAPIYHYKFEVAMSCAGCSGAVEKALGKQQGVQKVSIDLPSQLVLVDAIDPATLEVVRAKIEKTGKEIKSFEQITA